MASSGMIHRVAFVRTDVSEELKEPHSIAPQKMPFFTNNYLGNC
jgi:hypothetical protein